MLHVHWLCCWWLIYGPRILKHGSLEYDFHLLLLCFEYTDFNKVCGCTCAITVATHSPAGISSLWKARWRAKHLQAMCGWICTTPPRSQGQAPSPSPQEGMDLTFSSSKWPRPDKDLDGVPFVISLCGSHATSRSRWIVSCEPKDGWARICRHDTTACIVAWSRFRPEWNGYLESQCHTVLVPVATSIK